MLQAVLVQVDGRGVAVRNSASPASIAMQSLSLALGAIEI